MYLNSIEIIESFININSRFNALINPYVEHVDLTHDIDIVKKYLPQFQSLVKTMIIRCNHFEQIFPLQQFLICILVSIRLHI
jgi:hypothetical protein